MAITFALRESPLHNPVFPGMLMVQSSTALKVGKARLIGELARQSSIPRASDAGATMESLGVVVASLCSNGQAVEIPGFGTVTPRARGKATETGEWIKTPEAYMTFRFDKKLLEAFNSQVELQQKTAIVIRPTITHMWDGSTGIVNSVLTPGSVLSIKGKNLKLDITRSDEGVWLLPVTEGGTAVKIAKMVDNTYSRLTCEIPAELVSGTGYYVEVRARRNSKNLIASICETVMTVV